MNNRERGRKMGGGLLEPRTAAAIAACVAVLNAAQPVEACWPDTALDLRQQLVEASAWGLIRVLRTRLTPTDPILTEVELEFIDYATGMPTGQQDVISYRYDVPTSPQMEVGEYYVVLLRSGRNTYEPVRGDVSVFKVRRAAGSVGPLDSVTLNPAHRVVLPGRTEPETSTPLWVLMNWLTSNAP